MHKIILPLLAAAVGVAAKSQCGNQGFNYVQFYLYRDAYCGTYIGTGCVEFNDADIFPAADEIGGVMYSGIYQTDGANIASFTFGAFNAAGKGGSAHINANEPSSCYSYGGKIITKITSSDFVHA